MDYSADTDKIADDPFAFARLLVDIDRSLASRLRVQLTIQALDAQLDGPSLTGQAAATLVGLDQALR
jgi:hypothetical protein